MTRIRQPQWQRRLSCRSAVVRLLGLWVRIPPEAWMFVSCECCVLYLRRADHSYRGIPQSVRVSECDRDASIMKMPWHTRGCCVMEKNEKKFIIII
jgi:hypothetical protein